MFTRHGGCVGDQQSWVQSAGLCSQTMGPAPWWDCLHGVLGLLAGELGSEGGGRRAGERVWLGALWESSAQKSACGGGSPQPLQVLVAASGWSLERRPPSDSRGRRAWGVLEKARQPLGSLLWEPLTGTDGAQNQVTCRQTVWAPGRQRQREERRGDPAVPAPAAWSPLSSDSSPVQANTQLAAHG